MSVYNISKIYPSDQRSHHLIDMLLADEGIRRDINLDYTCGIFDDDMNIIATGSCFNNTLRCLAVSSAHQGEGLMNQVVTHLMEEQFLTYGSARVMVSNITYTDAQKLVDELEAVKGVKEVAFDDSEDHYTGTNALYDITFSGEEEEQVSKDAMNAVRETLADYDTYVSTEVGAEEETSKALAKDMNLILVLAVIIIVAVLLLSTKAYMEIPVLLITFGVAAILNKGTNYWLGTISSVTDSIAVVLQLALAIDYAIILCDRFMEEHETMDAESAVKVALSKAIPEISASSLTTISGMVAMMFMQFRLGYDMGIVLVKAIIFSLVSVFLLMPGILLLFAKGIDNSHHRC